MMFCHWTILDLVIIYFSTIEIALKLRVLLTLKCLPPIVVSVTLHHRYSRSLNKGSRLIFYLYSWETLEGNLPHKHLEKIASGDAGILKMWSEAAIASYGVYLSQLFYGLSQVTWFPGQNSAVDSNSIQIRLFCS
jgi:hypothetical protein